MPPKSKLYEQLATMGIVLPEWTDKTNEKCDANDWIKQGKACAETIRLAQAQLRNAPQSSKQVIDQLVDHLRETTELALWDQLIFATIKTELNGTPNYERWQIYTKLVQETDLKPAHLLGITLELAREKRLSTAIYSFKRLLKEHSGIDSIQRIQLCAELVNSANKY